MSSDGDAEPTADAVRLLNAAIAPGRVCDVAFSGGVLVTPAELPPDVEVIDLAGRVVLAGLVDHHTHLLATAAAAQSVDLSPGAVQAAGSVAAVLQRARHRRPDGWLRAHGYDTVASGPIDRELLDTARVGPVRIQDRSGVGWLLDTIGLGLVAPVDPDQWPPGTEFIDGQPSGWFHRADSWLRSRFGAVAPDLTALGAQLAARGVTTVVDASVTNGAEELEILARSGLLQRIVAMTGTAGITAPEGVELGAHKIVLDDVALPALDDLAASVTEAHAGSRNVAVHCVDAAQLVLALSAGLGPGDRIEHGSVIPDAALPLLARCGVAVVTQPGLVRSRGDRYLVEVDPDEIGLLYRFRSLLAAGVPVAIGTDSPYGPTDPWVHVAAATERRTEDGTVIGADEAVDVRVALRALQRDPTAAERPGPGLVVGAPADLFVVDGDWDQLCRDPEATRVDATWVAGRPVHRH